MGEETVFKNKLEDLDIRFSHGMSVKINNGYYRGYEGKVMGYGMNGKKLCYNVQIAKLGITIIVEERDLTKKGLLW
jgi:hypothetical protein